MKELKNKQNENRIKNKIKKQNKMEIKRRIEKFNSFY